MTMTAKFLESDLSLLQHISRAKQNQDPKTVQLLKDFRNGNVVNVPNCLIELRNGQYVGSGDYIHNDEGTFYLRSANGTTKKVDAAFVYDFCWGCAHHYS
ncbi:MULTISPECIES: hypothetical protein [Pontibacillus]|uniref:Uncharacterized protein n=1 Tax=Pontibacillus chungwhensis TaxID=265426 RepID=A0ABY8UZ29_9BACI|nr:MULTISPECIES: hypothetical protein [Pontibacillus]MCD5325518.1 hypothetical protein [Pontibacillus sp. HN14]WIF98628.1 hypothetical protein QNI29_02870 [Pontibacillus chungwhensis]